jgi:hypothetical protein
VSTNGPRRFDPYSFVHKAQRARLFTLVIDAGRADQDDHRDVETIGGAVRALVRELRNHADHEEKYIHPLLRSCAPSLASQLEEEHHDVDRQMIDLERAAGSADLYRSLTNFTASYLRHLELEEGSALPALWKGHTDEELMQVRLSCRGARSEVENLTSALSQLPTLSPSERARFLAVVLGARDRGEIGELLAVLLSPDQLGRLG